MKNKINIAAVSYLNTKPFLYGIKKCLNTANFELNLFAPAKCAETIKNKQAEIGLIPVAALPELKDYRIISNFCIGSIEKVDSVCLYSNQPINKITNIELDFESKTSVNLVKILAKKHWEINPSWSASIPGFEQNISGTSGAVVIGDKTFAIKNKYAYTYDLASEWFKFSGLPFVFACWVASNKVTEEQEVLFNKALSLGINNISESILEFKSSFGKQIDVEHYFKNCISFDFDRNKKLGLQLFLNLLTENQQLGKKLLSIS